MNYQKGDYEFDRARSDRDFLEVVWPAIKREWDWFDGACLVPEDESKRLRLMMDTSANIDILARDPKGRLIGIASRVQYQTWRTFTVRYRRASDAETEFAKMMDALAHDRMTAGYMTHAYVSDVSRDLISAYGVRLRAIYENRDLGYIKTARSDGNQFLCIDIDRLVNRGVEVREITFDVDGFFAKLREKHHAYLHDKPDRLHGASWSSKCPRCDGAGRAPTPYAGYVRCGLCAGGGLVQKGVSR